MSPKKRWDIFQLKYLKWDYYIVFPNLLWIPVLKSLKLICFYPNQPVRASIYLPSCCQGPSTSISWGRPNQLPSFFGCFLLPKNTIPKPSTQATLSLLSTSTATLRLCRWSLLWGKPSSTGEQSKRLESKPSCSQTLAPGNPKTMSKKHQESQATPCRTLPPAFLWAKPAALPTQLQKLS